MRLVEKQALLPESAVILPLLDFLLKTKISVLCDRLLRGRYLS